MSRRLLRRISESLPSEYPLLFALSGIGIALGVAREGLLVLFFGFSDTTDTIHLYLLVTYALGLLTDPIRLAGLNLLQTMPLGRVAARAALILLPFAVAVTGATALLVDRALRLPLLIGIAATGVVMQLNQLTIAQRQRGGAVIPAQLVLLVPNLVLVPGIIAIGLGKLPDPVTGVLVCFFIVPIVQLVLLTRIRVEQPRMSAAVAPVAPVRLFAKHAATAVGRQGFEIVARTAMIALGEGFLTVFSLVTRIYVALRIVLVDTFIGARIPTWSGGGGRPGVPRALRNAPNPLLLAVPVAVGLVLALWMGRPDQRGVLGLGYAVFLLMGFPCDAGARILYFASNARAIPERLIMAIATLELAFAALVFGIVQASIAGIAVALLVWYVARPGFQYGVIHRALRTRPSMSPPPDPARGSP